MKKYIPDAILIIVSIIAITATMFFIRPSGFIKIPAGITVDNHNVGSMTVNEIKASLEKIVASRKGRIVKLKHGDKTWEVSLEKMGIRYDVASVIEDISMISSEQKGFWKRLLFRKWAKKGLVKFYIPIKYNRATMSDYFEKLKKSIDRPATQARVDLIKKEIVPGKKGMVLDISGSISAFEKAIQKGDSTSELVVEVSSPSIKTKQLEGIDLSKVMGWYETSYESWGKYADRVYNLRLGAAKITGTILMPGKELSFNQMVGPRTAKEGYRIAPVIAMGELVDDMGGGMCQIASTLFAASFFAGIDIINAKPHSQISHYIDLGLDSTVVYPAVDLVIRNKYPFPVVIRIDVSDGRVRAEILGRQRPYHKVGFERRIVKETPFQLAFRKDPELLEGEMKLDQRGQKGYIIRRRRIFFDEVGHEIKAQTWTLIYPPATMIIRKGTKKPDDPNWKAPEIEPFKPRPDPPRFRREMQ